MIYRFNDFDEGPHWEVAIIEAPTEAEARKMMRSYLEFEEDETVWSPRPEGEWVVQALENTDQRVLFVMGAGCR